MPPSPEACKGLTYFILVFSWRLAMFVCVVRDPLPIFRFAFVWGEGGMAQASGERGGLRLIAIIRRSAHHSLATSGSSSMATPTKATTKKRRSDVVASPSAASTCASSSAQKSRPHMLSADMPPPLLLTSTRPQATAGGHGMQIVGCPGFEDEEDDDEPVQLSPMSLNRRFPTGKLGQSLQRIRNTVNVYACRTSVGWYYVFKVGTVKALERRFLGHEVAVAQSLHLDMIGAFRDLKTRIQSVIALWRSLGA